MDHSRSDRGTIIDQDSDATSFYDYPPGQSQEAVHYRRTASRPTDIREVNPRAEIATSYEQNNPGAGLTSLGATAAGLISIVEEDALTLQPPSPDVPASTARVRTGSDSSGSHSPRQETSITEVPGEQTEECVPNTEHDHTASRFRTRYAPQPGFSTEAAPQPTGETTGYGRDVETRPEIPTESLENLFDLWSYTGRMETYRLFIWRHPFLAAEVLAEAGLFYNGDGDFVECVNCGGRLGDWEPGDDPREEHRKHYQGDCF